MKEFLTKLFGEAVTDEAMLQFDKEIGLRFVAKSDYNAKLEEIKGLNTQISDRDKQLKELKDSAGDNEALQARIKELQDTNKKAEADFNNQMQALKFDAALDKALLTAKAVDSDLVKVKLDRNALKLKEDGTIEGLSEQLEGVQKNYGFLFESGKTTIDGATPPPSGTDGGSTDPFLQGFES